MCNTQPFVDFLKVHTDRVRRRVALVPECVPLVGHLIGGELFEEKGFLSIEAIAIALVGVFMIAVFLARTMIVVVAAAASAVVFLFMVISPTLVQRPFCPPHPRVDAVEQCLGKLGLERQEESDGGERLGVQLRIESVTRKDNV